MTERERFSGLSDAQLHAIHVTCESFERALLDQEPARIEDHLEGAAEATRRPLLQELLAIEIEWRLLRRERPSVSEYHARFPAHADVIRDVFNRVSAEQPFGSAPLSDDNGPSHSVAKQPSRIDRYRIDKVLGKGGFGIVYKAYDEQLGRAVAIKVPHAKLVSRREFAEAYLAEAQSVARLDHPHIVSVHDIGSNDQFPCYVVSAYVEGMSLAEKLKKARLDYRTAAELVATMPRRCSQPSAERSVHCQKMQIKQIATKRDS